MPEFLRLQLLGLRPIAPFILIRTEFTLRMLNQHATLFLAVFLAVLALQPFANGQAASSAGTSQISSNLSSVEYRLLEQRVNSELASSRQSYDALSSSINRLFYSATGLTALLVFWAFLRDHKVRKDYQEDRKLQRQDYSEERKFYHSRVLEATEHQNKQYQDYKEERHFYEERVLNAEKRQVEYQTQQQKDVQAERTFFFERILEREKLAKEAADREAKLGGQQIGLGESLLKRSEGMLSQQIDNMAKLGNVIDLVKNTFALHLKKEEEEAKLFEKLAKTTDVLDHYNEFFHRRFEEVQSMIEGSMRDMTAMSWARLSPDEAAVFQTASTQFESIPSFIVEKKDEVAVAKILSVLGTSAFYSNNVALAVKHLERAHKLFSKHADRDEKLAAAYCNYFLALVEKSWIRTGQPLIGGLQNAVRHLEFSCAVFKQDPRCFLMEVTIAEIMSYIDQKLESAAETVSKLLTSLDGLKQLNPNQNSIRARAVLIQGNVHFRGRGFEAAISAYLEGMGDYPKNPYFPLSIGHTQCEVGSSFDDAKSNLSKGLDLLYSSGVLERRELTVRMIAIIWAIFASSCLKLPEKKAQHLLQFEQTLEQLNPVAGREPLFFNPLTKKVCTSSEIKAAMTELKAKVF